MKKAVLIFSAIIIGSIFTFGHAYTFLIRYNLMVMLFFAFLSIKFDWRIFQKKHYKVLSVNILSPIILFLLIHPIHSTYAQIIFILTVIPTAAAGPVIAEIMKANIAITTGSVLLTTPIIALLLPFLLSNLLGVGGNLSVIELVLPILMVVFVPLIISQGLRFTLPDFSDELRKIGFISFPLFLINIIIACGNASHFIQQNLGVLQDQLIWIFGITTLVCVINFQIGRFIGGKENTLAFELAMGRKNTMIGLWLALTYFSPIIALGPIFYIVCHNTYNSVQMWLAERNGGY